MQLSSRPLLITEQSSGGGWCTWTHMESKLLSEKQEFKESLVSLARLSQSQTGLERQLSVWEHWFLFQDTGLIPSTHVIVHNTGNYSSRGSNASGHCRHLHACMPARAHTEAGETLWQSICDGSMFETLSKFPELLPHKTLYFTNSY